MKAITPSGRVMPTRASTTAKNNEKFLKGGSLRDDCIDALATYQRRYVEEYAKLPTKEVLISKLLFMLQSPMQRLAIAASEIAKKKESEEGAA